MAVQFEKLQLHLISQLSVGKVTKFQRIISNALKGMDKNLWGVPKGPSLDSVEHAIISLLFSAFSFCIATRGNLLVFSVYL